MRIEIDTNVINNIKAHMKETGYDVPTSKEEMSELIESIIEDWINQG